MRGFVLIFGIIIAQCTFAVLAIPCPKRGSGYKCVLKGTCTGTVEAGGCCPKTECCAPVCTCPTGYQVLVVDGVKRCYLYEPDQYNTQPYNKALCDVDGAMLYCPETETESVDVFTGLSIDDALFTCFQVDGSGAVDIYDSANTWSSLSTPPFGSYLSFFTGQCIQIFSTNVWSKASCNNQKPLLCQKECVYA